MTRLTGNILETLAVSDLSTPAFIDKSYGEPLFHTASPVSALQYAADDTLWSIEESGILRQWSEDGRLLSRVFLSDNESLWAFSDTSEYLASGGADLSLWEVATGKLLHRVEADTWLETEGLDPVEEDDYSSWVTRIQFSADGRHLATGHDDGLVCVWDAIALSLLHRFEVFAREIPVSALCFKSDGTQIAAAGEDRLIAILDVETGAEIVRYPAHPDRIPSLAWSPDGKLLVSAGWDTSARVWEPPSADAIMLLNKHSQQVDLVRFSPDGRYLACADSDFTLRVWGDPRTGDEIVTLRGHTDEITCLSFSQNGHRLASSGPDCVVHVWDLEKGELLAGPDPSVRHRVALDGVRGVLYSNARINLQAFDVATGAAGWLPESAGTVESVAVSPDGHFLATSNSTADVSLFDLRAKTFLRTFTHTRGPISSLVWSADSSELICASLSDGLIWVWKPELEEAVLVIPEAADGATLEAVCCRPGLHQIAVGGLDIMSTGESDGAACLWDLDTRELVVAFGDGVTSLCFDPKGKYLAGGSLTQKVILWDLDTQEKYLELSGHQDRISSMSFSPDGNWLVSGGDDSTLRVWNVLTGKMLVVRQCDSAVQTLTFSADGRYLYSGNGNTTLSRIDFSRLLSD